MNNKNNGLLKAINKIGKFIMVTTIILFILLILTNAYKFLKVWDVHPFIIISLFVVAGLCSLLAYIIGTSKELDEEKVYWERKKQKNE